MTATLLLLPGSLTPGSRDQHRRNDLAGPPLAPLPRRNRRPAQRAGTPAPDLRNVSR
jgi:hypothetical protein